VIVYGGFPAKLVVGQFMCCSGQPYSKVLDVKLRGS